MIVGMAEIKIDMPWAQSLKEKRMVVQSIIAKTQNMFHISVAQTAEQDRIKTAVLGMAVVGNSAPFVSEMLEKSIDYIQSITEGDVTVLQKEMV